jgi:hypothetical protein
MDQHLRDIDAGLVRDPESFRRHVCERCEPVVVRGACSDWPARHAAERSLDDLAAYLLRFDGGVTAEAFVGMPDIDGRFHYDETLTGFNFAREELGLRDVLARIAEGGQRGSSVYMGSLPADRHLPGFADENRASMVAASVRPRIWLGSRSEIACHYDTYDNLACVVAGRRRFTLYPPDAIADLYVGPIDHTMAGQPVGLAEGSEPGDPRYPRFERTRGRAIVVELDAGDALYLPKLWWHRVEATAPFNLLVNYWWDGFSAGPDAPYTAMMLAMIAIAERPAGERAAWRAFFDHYVFRSHGHPLAHLPEEKRGLLGPLRSGNYRRIRAIVMQLLRGD